MKSFCRGIVKGGSPVYVDYEPLPRQPVAACFEVVPEHVARHGGEQRNGWAIWYWRDVMIEAEFHCIWQRPDEVWVDISPRSITSPRTLFLDDPSSEYEGVHVDNIRKPLSKDPIVKKFIGLTEELFRVRHQAHLANDRSDSTILRIRELAYQISEIQVAMREAHEFRRSNR